MAVRKTLALIGFASILIGQATGAFSQSKMPNDIIGTWQNEQNTLKLEFFNAGSEYNARLVWGDRVVEPDGKTFKLDANNPDPSLRSRSLQGIVLIKGLTWKGGQWTGGTFYAAPTGQTYNCEADIAEGKLHMRGYIGTPLFGQTQVFTRVSAPEIQKTGHETVPPRRR